MAASDLRQKPGCSADDALAVLKRLREAGHVAYFAGGCVRDSLLGLDAKDWDVATDAPPTRVRELFPNTQAVGAAFGVILVRQRKSVVEVATFRADGVYEDGRRPSSVRFTSAEEDAKRRDFTINGLFLDPIENRVIDFVGGREDLAAKRIRAIGVPAERFGEDHLRLLRAVRFAARLGFEIEAGTAEAIAQMAPRLKGISPERVGDELRIMLTAATRGEAWKLIWELGLGAEVFRFLPGRIERMDFSRSLFLKLISDVPFSFGLAPAAGVLCVQLQAGAEVMFGRKEVNQWARGMRQAIRTSNEEDEEMTETLAGLEGMLGSERPTLAAKKRFARATSAGSRVIMEGLFAIGLHRDRIAELRGGLSELAKGEVAPMAFINGDDLTAMGFNPGPRFRKILDAVYDAQLEDRITSKTEGRAFVERYRDRD